MKLVGEDEDFLAGFVTFALWVIALIVCVATVTGLVESYNGLYIWFATHHITGIWADIAPLAVDSFTVMGELGIFVAVSRKWDWQSRFIPWVAAILGFCASVAANVGDKVQFHSIPTDLTASVFPVAGALGLVLGLGLLKRVAQDHTAKVAARKAAKTLTPEEINAQLLRDNAELQKKLQEKPAEVIDISPDTNPDMERKGIDVLIPPQTPVTAPTAVPTGVSREEARRRQADLPQYRDRVISPEGLDVRTTGQFAVIPQELR